MRIDLDMGEEHFNKINSYDNGRIKINDRFYSQNIIISPTELITEWEPKTIEELQAKHLQAIVALKPEIVLIGTGETLIFPNQAVLMPLLSRQIGVEIMTTIAACRTFNILMSENRQVVAALFIALHQTSSSV